jgi:hypothetical protein
MAVALASGETGPASDADDLLRLLLPALSRGDHDFSVCALLEQLYRTGQHDCVTDLANRYRTMRREAYPVPRVLEDTLLTEYQRHGILAGQPRDRLAGGGHLACSDA